MTDNDQLVITQSRQHYIRFNLPEGYQRLIAAGITDDYSMGYGSVNGFRASVASSFYWYDLEKEVLSLIKHLPGNKILIDHFLDRCQEAEIDAIFDGDDFHVMGVMEHIEPAGIHSGDSNAVLPQFNLSPLIVHTMEEYAEKIARALQIKGLINIQFAIKDGNVYVIEANPRASRTTPFIAKAYQIPYLNIATKIMLGVNKVKDFTFDKKLTGFAIKEPVFSFNKFPGVNKELGPEMKSTGEAIRFIKDLRDPYFRQLYKERSMHLSK